MVNSGYRQSLYWGNESSFGTGATINQPVGLVQSVNPTEENNLIKIRTLGGTRDYNNIVPGKFQISGSFDYYLQGAALLRQAIGEDTATTTTVDSGPKYHTGADTYLHVMGSAASPLVDSFPSFALEFTDDEDDANPGTYNLKRLYRGCRVNSCTLSGTVDEPVKVSIDFIGAEVQISTASPSSVTESTDDPYVFYQGAVYATAGSPNSTTVFTSSSAIAEVNGFDISINNNLEAIWYISGTTATQQSLRGVKKLIPKGRDYDANLNLHFADRKMYQRFLGNTSATTPQGTLNKYEIVVDFVRSGGITAVASSGDRYIRMVLASCAFDTINIPGAPEDVVSQTLAVNVEKAKFYVVDADASYQ